MIDFQFPPLWHEDRRKPVIATGAFVTLYGIYGATLMFFVLDSVPDIYESTGTDYALSNGSIAIGLLFLALSGLAYARQWVWRRQHETNESDLGWIGSVAGGTPLLALVVYLGTYFIVVDPAIGPSNPLPMVTAIQGTILLVVFGVSSAPLLPREIPDRDPVEYLQLYLTNWWRWAQLAMSFFFAFGIGIAATAYIETNLSGVVVHVLTSFVGIFYLAWYALMKINAVRNEIVEMNSY